MANSKSDPSVKPVKPAVPLKPNPHPGLNPGQFHKPSFNTPKFNTAFRNQNRGSGGK